MARTDRRDRPRLLAAAGLLGATLTVVGSTPLSSAEAGGCTEPHRPVYAAHSGPSTGGRVQDIPETPITPPEPTGPHLTWIDRDQLRVDTDGDGDYDRIVVDDDRGTVTIHRGDGTVVLELPDDEHAPVSRQVGDLDADGRHEILVGRPSTDPRERSTYFLVPGSTPTGTHQVEDVAVAVPPFYFMPAGDMVDGPGDDLVASFIDTDETPSYLSEFRWLAYSAVVSGEALMAPGPGGSTVAEPHGDLRIEGELVNLFDLGDDRPAIVTLTHANADREGGGVIHLHRNGRTTTFEHGYVEPNRISIQRYGDRLLLRGGNDTRSGSTHVLWDIEEPCRPLPVGTSGAGPAQPRAGEASYTG